MRNVTNYEWKPFSWYCPNCGIYITSYKNSTGVVKAQCKRCHVSMVRKNRGRNHITLDLFDESIDLY